MSATPPAIHDLARRLIAKESHDAAGRQGGALVTCEKLRGPLTKLAGAVGFSSLLRRALMIAKRNFPALAEFDVRPDGLLVTTDIGHEETRRNLVSAEAEAALVAELVFLLITLIGKGLTVRLMREIWPEMPFEDSSFSEDKS